MVLPRTVGGTRRGHCRDVAQGEGCEQGDPLAPALFALGQHAALCQASSALHASERLLAFFDDLYVLTTRDCAREARDTVVQAVQEGCGIASNDGKTRVYCHAGGAPPPGIAELGADVWRGNKAPSERGLVVLGTPIGHPHFIASWAESLPRSSAQPPELAARPGPAWPPTSCMNAEVPLADGRRIEVLANGLPLWQGAPAAVDTTYTTLVVPLDEEWRYR